MSVPDPAGWRGDISDTAGPRAGACRGSGSRKTCQRRPKRDPKRKKRVDGGQGGRQNEKKRVNGGQNGIPNEKNGGGKNRMACGGRGCPNAAGGAILAS